MTIPIEAESFGQALVERGPADLSVKFDGPRADGVVFIDITLEDSDLTVEWLPKFNAYGFCDCGDPGYGNHRDHILVFEAAVTKALEMLSPGEKVDA